MLNDRVPVALVRDDRQRHGMHRAARRTDQHCAAVVFPGHVAYVAVFLDGAVDAAAVAEDVVKNDVRGLAHAQHAHPVGLFNVWKRELHPDELVLRVDLHALALLLEDARLLSGVLAFAHEAFFVRPGYNRDRGCAADRQVLEHLEDADLRQEPVEVVVHLRLGRALYVLVDCVADDGYVDGLGWSFFGVALDLRDSLSLQSGPILREHHLSEAIYLRDLAVMFFSYVFETI